MAKRNRKFWTVPAFCLFAVANAAAAGPAPQDEILIAGNFTVSISGATSCSDTVSVDVDPIEFDLQEVTEPNDTGRWRRYSPGSPRFGQARFMFAIDQDDCAEELSRWILDVLQRGDAAARNIEIALYDRRGGVARRYIIHDAIAIGLASEGGLSIDAASGKKTAANLQELQVRIGHLEIAQGGDDAGKAGGSRRHRQDEYIRNYGFKVELSGGAETSSDDGPWTSITGGSAVVESVTETQRNETDRFYTPGRAYVSDITLTGYVTKGRKTLLVWLQNALKGSGDLRADLTITPVKIDGTSDVVHEYYDTLLRRVQIPRLSAGSAEPVRETVVLKAERYNDPK